MGLQNVVKRYNELFQTVENLSVLLKNVENIFSPSEYKTNLPFSPKEVELIKLSFSNFIEQVIGDEEFKFVLRNQPFDLVRPRFMRELDGESSVEKEFQEKVVAFLEEFSLLCKKCNFSYLDLKDEVQNLKTKEVHFLNTQLLLFVKEQIFLKPLSLLEKIKDETSRLAFFSTNSREFDSFAVSFFFLQSFKNAFAEIEDSGEFEENIENIVFLANSFVEIVYCLDFDSFYLTGSKFGLLKKVTEFEEQEANDEDWLFVFVKNLNNALEDEGEEDLKALSVLDLMKVERENNRFLMPKEFNESESNFIAEIIKQNLHDKTKLNVNQGNNLKITVETPDSMLREIKKIDEEIEG